VIKEARWSGWVWVGECFFWYRPTRVVPDQRPLNGRCCCCYFMCLYLLSFCMLQYIFFSHAYHAVLRVSSLWNICSSHFNYLLSGLSGIASVKPGKCYHSSLSIISLFEIYLFEWHECCSMLVRICLCSTFVIIPFFVSSATLVCVSCLPVIFCFLL